MPNHPATDRVNGPAVIDRGDDLATIRAVSAQRAGRPDAPLVAVVSEPDVARLYAGAPHVTPVAWLPALGRRVAAALPPRPRETVAPPPVVVGDGRIARYLVEAMIEGWADPGQPLDLHCLGEDPAWAQEASIVVEPHGRLTWSLTPSRPLPVARRVQELVAEWQAPARRRGQDVGPTVLVALADPVVSMAIAARLVASVPLARVGVVVPEADPWPHVDGVTVFSTEEARRTAVSEHRDPAALVAEHLLADVAWVGAPGAAVTRPVTPILAEASYDEEGHPLALPRQPAALRAQVTALAAALPAIAEAGGLAMAGVSQRVEPVILMPRDLLGMAAAILDALGVAEEPGTRQTAIELADRIPGIASRAGVPLRRPIGHDALLRFNDVECLAPLVHLAYQDISAKTDNATDSPLAGALWDQLTEFERAGNRAVLAGLAVAHAVVGLDWRRSDAPVVYAPDAAQLERLAELEHRRWAIHQRRNGAGDHRWMLPWDGPAGASVTEDAKEYDRHIMRQVIGFLAAAGIEVR